MEKAHSKAVAAIEAFVAQASTAQPSPRFIANTIQNATSSPNTFVFGELLDTPAVQALRQPDVPDEYRSYLTLLEIFAWGTWEEYHSTPNLPALNEAQQEKLRLVTLITLARQHVPLTYDITMKSLSLETTSALEALVTNAIYLNLLSAKMSPTTKPSVIYVTATAPMRDMRPNAMPDIMSTLNAWHERCGSAAVYLQSQIESIHQAAKARCEDSEAFEERHDRLYADSNDNNTDKPRKDVGKSNTHAQRGKRKFAKKGPAMDLDEDSDI
ncbi:hypothetical protein KEM56_006752 [Ascosphaera pollenicola]|nr:hypothetical protein KEM56_006752 [Ascosphaera pollenicola]